MPNQLVKKGTILFTLENRQQQITLDQAEAALAEAKNAV